MADEGHIATELIIRETEADVSRVYRQAAEETQKKLDAYLQKFKAKDAVKRAKLSAGEITKQEYDYWRTGQIAIGERWEEMRNTLAQDYHNANAIARSIVVSHMPEAYAVNHNYATFQVEKDSMLDTSYTLYDRQTVERIIRDQPDMLPPPGPQMKKTFADFDAYKQGQTGHLTAKEQKAFDKLINSGKDIRWQKGKIQSVVTQSILQGESIPNMARRVAREMGEINRRSTTRYVRTAMTGAQNAGRVDAYTRAQSMGIELEQEWLATLDGRTRDSHREMDGEAVEVGKMFSNHCRYPGDPSGPPEEIWNCRCTLVPRVKEIDQSNAPRDSRLGSMTYDEWKNEHNRKQIVEDQGIPEGVVKVIEFKRNKETGILEVWKNGKKIGEIKTMGDEVDGGD